MSNLYSKSEFPSPSKETGEFLYVFAWLAVFSGCFLELAYISFVAGIDLWRMKVRGRYLALFSMPLYLLVGCAYIIMGEIWSIWMAMPICGVGVFFFVYLLLPSIRRRFEASSTKST